jgi:hypothetical protein
MSYERSILWRTWILLLSLTPVVWVELAGDDGRADGVAVLEDLSQVPALLCVEGGAAEVIDDEDLKLGDLLEELWVRPIDPCLVEVAEEAWCPGVEDAIAVTAGYAAWLVALTSRANCA